MSIKNLEMRAKVVVQGFWKGLHKSPFHGFSVEFTEYRQYTPGDDPRYLDWKLYARSDRFHIKKFEDETNLRCYLLADTSKSMHYGTSGVTKHQYAATLAASMGTLLSQQGDAVGLLSFDEEIRDYFPARNRPGHLRRILYALDQPGKGAATNIVSPLEQAAHIIKKPGMVVVLSDFLAPVDQLESPLSRLCALGHDVVLFRVLDRAEVEFNFDEEAEFEDVESGQRLHIDPKAVKASYLEKFNAHRAELSTLLQGLGLSFTEWITDQPLELALAEFLRHRAFRGQRGVRRR